jgi:hypothetical protein
MKNIRSKPFIWEPGIGPQESSIKRQKEHFSLRPKVPMGEAWFMSEERKLYTQLVKCESSVLPTDYLAQCTGEIGSGTSCFGHFQEWDDWFYYLLPYSIERPDVLFSYPTLLEQLMSAFMVQNPVTIEEEYDFYRADILASLPLCVMHPVWWKNEFRLGMPKAGVVAGNCAYRCEGSVAISMFFCLKYLDSAEIVEWAASLFRIKDVYFIAQLVTWLAATSVMLEAAVLQQPAQFMKKSDNIVGWYGDWYITGNYTGDNSGAKGGFITENNRQAFVKAAKENISEALMLQWMSLIKDVSGLEDMLSDYLNQVAKAYT